MGRTHPWKRQVAMGRAHGLLSTRGLTPTPQTMSRGRQRRCGQGETALEASRGPSPAFLSLLVSISSRSLLTANILPLPRSPQPILCSSESLPLISSLALVLLPSSTCQPHHTQHPGESTSAEEFQWAQTWSRAGGPQPHLEHTRSWWGTVYAGLPSGSSPGASKSLVFVLLPRPGSLLPPFSSLLLSCLNPCSSCDSLPSPVLSGPDKVINRPGQSLPETS